MCFSSSPRSGTTRFRRNRCPFSLPAVPNFTFSPPTAADDRNYRDSIAALRPPMSLTPRPPAPGGALIPGSTRTVFFFSASPYLPKISDRFSFPPSTFQEISAFLLSLASPRYRIILAEGEGRAPPSGHVNSPPSTRGRAASQKGTVLRKRKGE